MNIGELNSYVRERCGGVSSALLKSPEISLLVLGEISLRQSQMIEAGKPLVSHTVIMDAPLTKSGAYIYRVTPLPSGGEWTFNSNPTHGMAIVVDGVTFTFKSPGITLASAGTAAIDGFYPERGTYGDKPDFNLLGEPTSVPPDTRSGVVWESNLWLVYNADGEIVYYSGEQVDSPELVEDGFSALPPGDAPGPTVTRLTFGVADVEIGDTKEETAANFAAKLNASTNGAISVATYEAVDNIVPGTYDTTGTGGNVFTMAASSGGFLIAVAVSGPTFTGGVDAVYETLFPDYVRIDLTGSGTYDLLEIVNDIDELAGAEEDGRYAIMFYGTPIQYELSWEPSGEESLQLWNDSDISTLLEVASAGTRLPARFDYAVGDAAAVKCLALVAMRDESKRTFVDLQSRILEADLQRWERNWTQYLYQSAAAGSVGQQAAFGRSPRRRIRRFPYN